MVLLIEGCERVGKSTLAEQFSRDLGLPVIHRGVPPPESEKLSEFFLEPLQRALKEHEHFILDRFHLSNRSYGQTFGGASLSVPDYTWVDRHLAEMDTWLFLMVDDPRNIYERVVEEGKDLLTLSEIGMIQNRFNECYEHTRISPKGSFKLPQLIERKGTTLQYRQIERQLRANMEGKCLHPIPPAYP